MKLYLFAAALCLLALPAQAAQEIGTYDSWAAYSFVEDGGKVCYMVSSPVSTDGDYIRRGNVYAMVTHRPKGKEAGVFSYIPRYDYKRGSPVTVTIDGQPIILLGADQVAWTADEASDRKLTEALRRGQTMVVTGTSSRNIDTKDTFNLSGSGSAYKAISKECDIIQ